MDIKLINGSDLPCNSYKDINENFKEVESKIENIIEDNDKFGDMKHSVYDPNNKRTDIYNIENMTESDNKKILTNQERINIEESKKANHEHNNKSILDEITKEKIDKWDAGGEGSGGSTGGGGSPTNIFKYGLEILKDADILVDEQISFCSSCFIHNNNKYALVSILPEETEASQPVIPNNPSLPPMPNGGNPPLPPQPPQPQPGQGVIKLIKIDTNNAITEIDTSSIDFADDDIMILKNNDKIYLVGSSNFIEGTINSEGNIIFNSNQANLLPAEAYVESVTNIGDKVYAAISTTDMAELYLSEVKDEVRQVFKKVTISPALTSIGHIIGFESQSTGYIYILDAMKSKGTFFKVNKNYSQVIEKVKEVSEIANSEGFRCIFRLENKVFGIENHTFNTYLAPTSNAGGVAQSMGKNYYPMGVVLPMLIKNCSYDNDSKSLFCIHNDSIYTFKYNE